MAQLKLSEKIQDARATLGVLGGKVSESEWEFIQMVREYLSEMVGDAESLEKQGQPVLTEARP